MQERKIVFLTLSHFYLKALQLSEREVSSKPIAVVKDGMVLDVSREATRWGVKAGDWTRQANRRCPGLQTIEFNPDSYTDLYDRAWNVFAAITPIVEPTDYHQGYWDITGCEQCTGCKSSTELMRLATNHLLDAASIRCAWGCGKDKWMARLAGSDNRVVLPHEELAFLEHVPIQLLDIPEELVERFRRYGICTIAQLMNVPDAFLQSHLQLSKQELQQLRLRDSAPVRALFPPAQLDDKEILLWADDAEIDSALHNLTRRLRQELESRNLQAGMIKFTIQTRQQNIVQEHKLTRPCSDPEHLNRLLHDLLPEKHSEEWREFRVILNNLTPRFQPQVDLWQNKHSITEVNHPLQAASERLQKKFGFQVLRSGTEYSHSVPPRFAQLIYELRGISLP